MSCSWECGLLGCPLSVGPWREGNLGCWLGRLLLEGEGSITVEGVEDKSSFAGLKDCLLNFAIAASFKVCFYCVGDFDF